MSDPDAAPPLPPSFPPPPPTGGNRGVGWFFAVSGSIVLLLTVGCILALTWEDFDMIGVGILCGSPTLILGAVFLWLGSRRLKR